MNLSPSIQPHGQHHSRRELLMGPLKEPEDTPRDVFMKRRHAQATPGLQACQGHPSAVRTKNQGRVSTPPTPSGPTICPSFPKVQPHGQVARAHPHVTSAHVLALPGTLSACLAQSPPFQFQAHHHQVHRNPSNSCYYTRQAPSPMAPNTGSCSASCLTVVFPTPGTQSDWHTVGPIKNC